jgi:cyclophilin family peptidyl-prolyl cis-trans isomerase
VSPHGGKVFATWLVLLGLAAGEVAVADNPRVRLVTDYGAIELELYAAAAPLTVRNFLNYVESGYYDGTIFHRVIRGFMIQGGGFLPGMKPKPAGVPIRNEADNGLKNLAGTIAMARTADPHSATAQFFINTVDNPFLDHRDKTAAGWGYAVFGKVIEGMEVVKRIEAVPTRNLGPYENVPSVDIVIRRIERIDK